MTDELPPLLASLSSTRAALSEVAGRLGELEMQERQIEKQIGGALAKQHGLTIGDTLILSRRGHLVGAEVVETLAQIEGFQAFETFEDEDATPDLRILLLEFNKNGQPGLRTNNVDAWQEEGSKEHRRINPYFSWRQA